MSGFYPHGKPNTYAYTTKFVKYYGGKTGYLAGVNTKYPGLSSDQGKSVVIKALWNLEALIAGARAAELAFLKDTGIELDDPNSSNIFHNINKILNSKETFERGLKYMEELNRIGRIKDEKTHTYRDVSSFLETYLNQELKKIDGRKILHMSPAQIEQEINKVIGNALKQTYTQVKDFVNSEGDRRLMMGDSRTGKAAPDIASGEQEQQAITDMINAIEELQELGSFGQFGYLFKLTTDNFKDRVKEIKKNKKKKKLSKKKNKAATGKYNEAEVYSNFQGNALELITSTVAAMLGSIHTENQGLIIQGSHTGQLNQMKADSLLFVGKGKINIDEYFKGYKEEVKALEKAGENSVRNQNVIALKNFLDKLEGKLQHVIAISDKNYSIKADFGGIAAQEKMRLQDAGRLLSRFGVDQITELITYLANCGASMVQGEPAEAIRTELQSYIGYFLFDNLHIEVQGNPSVNVVNLINVSGLYIPLSVYLEGLYNSIQSAASDPSSFVNVTITLGGPTEQSVWTADTWADFRDDRETQSFITYKILKNLADFIAGLA